jgi:hypothetical protein
MRSPESGRVDGTLEVTISNESVCLSLTGLRFSEANLTKESELVSTFLTTESQGGDICNEVPSENLREVLQHPDDYRLTVRLVNGTTTASDLIS